MTERRFLLLLFLLALLVKLVYMGLFVGFDATPAEGAAGDGVWYDRIARNVLAGRGYSADGVSPTANKPPGYPLFMATVYAICHPPHGYAAVKIIQALLLAAVSVFVYFIGKAVFCAGVGAMGALFVAVDPLLIYLSAAFLSEPLYIFLSALMGLLFMRAERSLSWWIWGILGLLLGVAAFVRLNTLLFMPAVLVWCLVTYTDHKRWQALGLMLGLMLGVISPWVLRNYRVYGVFPYPGSSGGMTFWGSNNPYADGDMVESSEMPELFALPEPITGEVERDRAYLQQGIAWIRAHPKEYMLLLVKKLLRLYDFDSHSERPQVRSLYRTIGFFSYGILLPFIIGGWVLALANRRALVLHLFIGAVTLGALVFYGDPRIRSPIQPYLFLFAAHALQRLGSQMGFRLQPDFGGASKGRACLLEALSAVSGRQSAVSEEDHRNTERVAEFAPMVTIVMPILNEERHLARCLQSVLDQDYPPDKLEILVVDGMSHDRSRALVNEFASRYPGLKLLDNPRRIIPVAMNIGIRNARGEVILRVDGHCFLEPDYIRQCLKHLDEAGADNVGGPAWAVGESYIGKAIALALGSLFGHGGSPFRYSQDEYYVDTVFLGAFRRELFDRVGFYDECFPCGEDYELNHRIREAGGKILLTPSIKVQYLTRNSLWAFCRQYVRYGFWRFQLIRKHPKALRIRHLTTAGFVLAFIISALAALLNSAFSLLFLVVISSYLVISVISSLLIACRRGWRYLPILPVVFACLHLSWGSGFLWALMKTALLRGFNRGRG